MKLDKRLLIAGAVGLAAIALAGGGFLANQMISNNFGDVLTTTITKASSSKIVVGESSLNIFTGTGRVKSIAIKDGQSANQNLFESSDIEFSYAPTSLLFGPLRIQKISTGPLKIVSNISGSKSSMAALVLAIKAKLAAKTPSLNGTKIIVEELNIGKGRIKIGISMFGRKTQKEVAFPAIRLASLGGKENGISPVKLAQAVLYSIGKNAVNMTSSMVSSVYRKKK